MTKQILLVEDNAANRKLLCGVLLRAGYEVCEAVNADDGLALALTESFDLIVMDIQLPGTDGLTATRVLRADDQTAHIPVLAVTAHAMRGDESRIIDAGCAGYVTKPIDYKSVLNEVDRLLASSATV
jgi:two-component system cell cycle response regulator DivK